MIICRLQARDGIRRPALAGSLDDLTENAVLHAAPRHGGVAGPLPERRPIGVDHLLRGLAVVNDVAELLKVHRIHVVGADIEDAAVDHPEFGMRGDRLAIWPSGIAPEPERR